MGTDMSKSWGQIGAGAKWGVGWLDESRTGDKHEQGPDGKDMRMEPDKGGARWKAWGRWEQGPDRGWGMMGAGSRQE